MLFRSIRSLADFIERNPETIIQGRGQKKVNTTTTENSKTEETK